MGLLDRGARYQAFHVPVLGRNPPYALQSNGDETKKQAIARNIEQLRRTSPVEDMTAPADDFLDAAGFTAYSESAVESGSLPVDVYEVTRAYLHINFFNGVYLGLAERMYRLWVARLLGECGGRAWMALDVLIDQFAEGHLCLTSAFRFDVTLFGGHEPRQLAGRQPLATHHNFG